MFSFKLDQDGNGLINFSDLWSFLTQKLFGFPLYLLAGAAGGVYYYFFHNKKKRYPRAR